MIHLLVRMLSRSVALTAVLWILAPEARAVFITFDADDPIGGLAVGTTLGNQYAAFGVTFAPNGFSGTDSPTGSWGTNTDMTIVSSTGNDVGGLGLPPLVSGNILRSFNGWLDEDGDASFQALFSTPITSFSAAFAGIATPSTTRIFAYDGLTLLSTVSASGSDGQQILSVTGTHITSVVITPGAFNDWVGVDNINFTPTSAVPEPGSLILVTSAGVIGLGATGLRRRRRRRDCRGTA